MAVINVDDIYVLDETGAQVDKVTGLFTKDEGTTSGEKAFAQLNIGTAGSNRNLLDNPWFTVNQRGLTSYAVSNAYTVDRWKERGNATITVNSDGTLTIPADTSYGFQQTMSWMPSTGETITVTALHSDGTVSTKTLSMPSSSYLSAYTNGISFVINPTQKIFAMLTNTEVTLKAVKFELGSVSTLANDAPPDYWQELDKCLYYFERVANNGSSPLTIGAGFADSVNNLYAPVCIHRKRAGISTISTSGAIYAGQRSSNISVSSVSKYNSSPDGIITLLATTSSAFTNNGYYRLALGAGAHIDFSADL